MIVPLLTEMMMSMCNAEFLMVNPLFFMLGPGLFISPCVVWPGRIANKLTVQRVRIMNSKRIRENTKRVSVIFRNYTGGNGRIVKRAFTCVHISMSATIILMTRTFLFLFWKHTLAYDENAGESYKCRALFKSNIFVTFWTHAESLCLLMCIYYYTVTKK